MPDLPAALHVPAGGRKPGLKPTAENAWLDFRTGFEQFARSDMLALRRSRLGTRPARNALG